MTLRDKSTLYPKIVGIYGLPGAGKTYLLNRLRETLHGRQNDTEYLFYEGSEVIDNLVPGGLEAFRDMRRSEQNEFRERAIRKIYQECESPGVNGVVTGHYMFWSEDQTSGDAVMIDADIDIFTHILYLSVPPKQLHARRILDQSRSRSTVTEQHLARWQSLEASQLREICYRKGIIFTRIDGSSPIVVDKVASLLHIFNNTEAEGVNTLRALSRLDEVIQPHRTNLRTTLVMDADKTLSPCDTGRLFWEEYMNLCEGDSISSPLEMIFGGSAGYTFAAFQQASLLYEEAVECQIFEKICAKVAARIALYPEIQSLLQRVTKHVHMKAIVVTCGIGKIWQNVLDRAGLSASVEVIGNGIWTDYLVVTAKVKAEVVSRLQKAFQTKVWAFGDSTLDLEMMKEANHAIVVVGGEKSRSRSMDAALERTIDTECFRPRQVLLPKHVTPRLPGKLPIIALDDIDFLREVLHYPAEFEVCHATDMLVAKILTTPMRDASISGPALRKAHERVGEYLGGEALASVTGLSPFPITHVQGNCTVGYKHSLEEHTLVVALMRGGEPIALGVSNMLPAASFLHAKAPEDITETYLTNCRRIVLVDSVISSGKTIIEFVERICQTHATVDIIVVAGVVQKEAIPAMNEMLKRMKVGIRKLNLIALRISENKYTGTGSVDTGNRLFNTKFLM